MPGMESDISADVLLFSPSNKAFDLVFIIFFNGVSTPVKNGSLHFSMA